MKQKFCQNPWFGHFLRQDAFLQLHTCRGVSSLPEDLQLAFVRSWRGEVCAPVPVLPLSRGWCNVDFRRSPIAETDPGLLVQAALADKSGMNQVILGDEKANMMRRDSRATVADDVVPLALRLCWCFIPWHRVRMCPVPDKGDPAQPHCHCVCSPSLALTLRPP